MRLHRTHLTGTVVDSNPGQVTLDLFSIDGRNPEFFVFSGTGGSIITDADPDNYEIDTAALDVSDFDPNEPARVFGFVTPFGAAPPDFVGETLVNFDQLRALLGVGWGFNGTDEPFLSMGSNGFVLNMQNPDLGLRQFLKVGSRTTNLASLPSPITVEPVDDGPRVYAIARLRRVEMYRDFGDFAGRVNSLLNGGSTLRALTARGTFEETTTTLTANYVTATFKAP